MPETTGAIALSWLELLFAASTVLVAAAVSIGLRLSLEKRISVAAVRMVLQLLMLGYVLHWVFAAKHVLVIVAILLFMTAMAGRAAVNRSSHYFRGLHVRSFVSLVLAGTVTTIAVTRVILPLDKWYAPQYLIPLVGMVLGNSLTGISLCIDYLLESFSARRDGIEMDLAHGATSWEAARDPVAAAVRRGMIPIINAMSVVGLVSIPGMMTGQILQGADPLLAVRYQIVIMFMIAASVALGCMLIAALVYRRLFDSRDRLLWAAIKKTD